MSTNSSNSASSAEKKKRPPAGVFRISIARPTEEEGAEEMRFKVPETLRRRFKAFKEAHGFSNLAEALGYLLDREEGRVKIALRMGPEEEEK